MSATLTEGKGLVSRRFLGFSIGVLLSQAACHSSKPEPTSQPSPTAAQHAAITQRVSLEINGYNYTDLYIDGFLVNGQGGGNIFVSSPTSGGGKSACCVVFSPGEELPATLRIKWTRDNKRWCEAEATLKQFIPANPQHLGVHFYPDGHIEAEIAENDPELKLKLEAFDDGQRKQTGNVVADEQTARCKDRF